MNNASCRSFVLPWKILVILIICLGGLSAHFLAVAIGHFTWEPVVETSSLDGDHGIHQDESGFFGIICRYSAATSRIPYSQNPTIA
jgi:hypothetical protein